MLRLGPVVVLLAWQLAAAGPAQAAAGELDPSFGTGGKVATDFPGSSAEVNALVLQADGTLVAAGQASSGSDYSTFDFALARYHPDGSLDPSFGSGGMVTTDFAGGTDLGRALVVQASGKLVVAGSATIGATTDFSAARTNDLDSVPGTGVAESTYLRRFWSPPSREAAGGRGIAGTEQVHGCHDKSPLKQMPDVLSVISRGRAGIPPGRGAAQHVRSHHGPLGPPR